ncbi:MAG: hypothetical protein F6J87_11575 [Spirulina sp. SIO3F2]|nr:hypothetical protein [Spirulina sp. SIO3F2]
MFKVVVGHSNDIDTEDAIAEVLAQCQQVLECHMPQAGLLLSAIDYDHRLVLKTIQATFPDIELIGGTTDGEISSVLGFEEDSLTLVLFCCDRITIRAGVGTAASQDIEAAVATAITQATNYQLEPIRLCITLPESLTLSGVTILNTLQAALGPKIPIVGGLTSTQRYSNQTYQFYGTEVYQDAVPVLTFAGPVAVAHGVASGWQPIGKAGVVTTVKDNIIYEIDHQPALDFYRYYLGDRPPSAEYPLAVFESPDEGYYMRAPSGQYDPVTGSVTLFGDVPPNAVVQLTQTTHDDILQASQASMQQALAQYPGTPDAALFFSCFARRQILGKRTVQEYQLAQNCLPDPIPSCGFYTNGEIAPNHPQGISRFHNETFVTLLLGEEDGSYDAG